MFSLFYEYSINEFYKSFMIFKNDDSFWYENYLKESINIAFGRKKPYMLQEIYSYFYEDEFEGIIF
jgi:hypothetical protein